LIDSNHIYGESKVPGQLWRAITSTKVDKFSEIFTIKFRKDLRGKMELKLPPPSNLLPHCLVKCKRSTMQLYRTVNSVQSDERCLITVNVRKGCYFFVFFSTQINFRHVFKMSTFGTFACFESWMPLVNGCGNSALFKALPIRGGHN